MKYNYEKMTEDTMDELLLELSGTPMYQAVLKFMDIQEGAIDTGLRSIDPFRNPTDITRDQGYLMGLLSLKQKVELLVENSKKIEEGK
jgi:hypothetical protein